MVFIHLIYLFFIGFEVTTNGLPHASHSSSHLVPLATNDSTQFTKKRSGLYSYLSSILPTRICSLIHLSFSSAWQRISTALVRNSYTHLPSETRLSCLLRDLIFPSVNKKCRHFYELVINLCISMIITLMILKWLTH